MHPRRRFVVPLPGSRSLTLGDRTLIMGVVNVTPDSFTHGSSAQRVHWLKVGLQNGRVADCDTFSNASL